MIEHLHGIELLEAVRAQLPARIVFGPNPLFYALSRQKPSNFHQRGWFDEIRRREWVEDYSGIHLVVARHPEDITTYAVKESWTLAEVGRAMIPVMV